MDIMNRLIMAGIVPVVVIDDAKDAVPVAEAMLAGGINVMEITFRTAAAPDAIKAVVDNCPGGRRYRYHAGAVQEGSGDGRQVYRLSRLRCGSREVVRR